MFKNPGFKSLWGRVKFFAIFKKFIKSSKLYLQHIFYYRRSPVSRNCLSNRKGFFFNILLDKVCNDTLTNIKEVNNEFNQLEEQVEKTIDQVETKFEADINNVEEKVHDKIEEEMEEFEDKVDEVVDEIEEKVDEVRTTAHAVIGVVVVVALLAIIGAVIAARNCTRLTRYVQYLDTLKGKEFYVWCCRLFLPSISFGL